MDAMSPLPLFPPSDDDQPQGAADALRTSDAPDAAIGSAEQRLALALRLLARYQPNGEPSLLPGQAPAGLPLTLPVPPGGRIVGSLLDAPPPQTTTATILIDTPLSGERLSQFYTEQLEALGWRLRPFPHPFRGGFAHMQAGGFMHTRFAADGSDYALTLTAIAGDTPEQTTLAIDVRRDDPAQLAQWRDRGPERMRGIETLAPLLLPPAGASQMNSGGGGGSGRWYSTARMETELPVAQVIAHYDTQLADGGWTRRDGGATGPAGWSFWSLKDEAGEPCRGLLLALNAPGHPRDYMLLLQIESENDPNRRQSGYTTHSMLSTRLS